MVPHGLCRLDALHFLAVGLSTLSHAFCNPAHEVEKSFVPITGSASRCHSCTMVRSSSRVASGRVPFTQRARSNSRLLRCPSCFGKVLAGTPQKSDRGAQRIAYVIFCALLWVASRMAWATSEKLPRVRAALKKWVSVTVK